MMMRTLPIALCFALSASHAQADGDPKNGAKVFKKCQACHVVADEEGEVLAGSRGRVGPNLYAVVGGPAGAVQGFGYSRALKDAGDAGLEWNAESFVAYVQDPTGYLRTYLDDPRARSAMSLRLRDEGDALDLFAFLSGLNPAP